MSISNIIARIIALLTGNGTDKVVRESRKAERKVAGALQTIKNLQAAVAAATEEAQAIAAAQAARIEAAITAADAEERAREDARKAELDSVIEEGQAAIRALEAALATAKDDAAAEQTQVTERHDAERAEAARNRESAAETLARLRTTGTKLGDAKAGEAALHKTQGF